MPNHHHHGERNGRREPRDQSLEGRSMRGPEVRDRTPRDAGGRSESFSRQRDAEQLRAGYSPREWDREDWARNTRSEPDWDPERGFAQRGGRWEEERHHGSPRYDRNEAVSAGRGYGNQGHYDDERWRFEQRDERPQGRYMPDWGPELRDDAGRPSSGRFGQQLADAGRRIVGKVKRVVRNPKNYRRSDERIREDICDRLSVSDEVDPVDIEVSVSNGEVTLTGTVPTRQMKFLAEETADDVPGVHDVHNQLRVARG